MKLVSTLGILAVAGIAVAANTSEAPAPAAGKVTGKILFEGEKPEVKPLKISEEQSKGCCADGSKVDDTDRALLIDKDGGIANCVVTIEVKGKTPKALEAAVEVDQKHCRFEPHVTVVPVGSTVKYLNSDGVSHNIHTYSVKNKGLNQAVSAEGELEQKLEKAENIKVACDYHPWMTSYIVVTDALHYTVTGADGSFTLEGVEPGEYTVDVWHETLGKGKGTVTVAADGSASALEIKMGAKKSGGGRRRR